MTRKQIDKIKLKLLLGSTEWTKEISQNDCRKCRFQNPSCREEGSTQVVIVKTDRPKRGEFVICFKHKSKRRK